MRPIRLSASRDDTHRMVRSETNETNDERGRRDANDGFVIDARGAAAAAVDDRGLE